MGAKSRKSMCELEIVGDGQTWSYKFKSYLHTNLFDNTSQAWIS